MPSACQISQLVYNFIRDNEEIISYGSRDIIRYYMERDPFSILNAMDSSNEAIALSVYNILQSNFPKVKLMSKDQKEIIQERIRNIGHMLIEDRDKMVTGNCLHMFINHYREIFIILHKI